MGMATAPYRSQSSGLNFVCSLQISGLFQFQLFLSLISKVLSIQGFNCCFGSIVFRASFSYSVAALSAVLLAGFALCVDYSIEDATDAHIAQYYGW